jgi:hypothetical protein
VAKVVAETPPIPDYIEKMNADHFVVNEGGKAVVYRETYDDVLKRPKLERMTFEDFSKLHRNIRVPVIAGDGRTVDKRLGDAWLDSRERRQYLGGIVFDPTNAARPDKYNLWRGFAVEASLGNWECMRTHIWEVICAKDDAIEDYVLNFLARMVQQPAESGQVALTLKGGEGTGKGVVCRAMVKIFGAHGLHVVHATHLVGQFNAHLRDVICLFADEAFFAGDAKHTSVLKGIITEPTLAIEAKYSNTIMVPNYLHLLMASNEEWVVPAGNDARRFCVLDVAPHRAGDHLYFKNLYAEMENGGLEAMLYDLLNRDISGFNVANFPRTNALADQQMRTLKGFDKWWSDALSAGELPHSASRETNSVEVCGQITTKDLFSSYSEFCRQEGVRKLARNTFGKKMREIATFVPRVSVQVDTKRVAGFDVGSLDQARQLFLKKLGVAGQFDE